MDGREWLLDRIETEVRAYANADSTTRQLRLGAVRAYLEVGAPFGYWSGRKAATAATWSRHRYRLRRIRRMLMR